jgi:hypothetical protein
MLLLNDPTTSFAKRDACPRVPESLPVIRLKSIRRWTARSLSDVCGQGGEHTDTLGCSEIARHDTIKTRCNYVQRESARA